MCLSKISSRCCQGKSAAYSRRVANYIMQLRKSNKKMWEDFYRTFFSEDEYG